MHDGERRRTDLLPYARQTMHTVSTHAPQFTILTSPRWGVKYCDQRVCLPVRLSVCLCARISYLDNHSSKFPNFPCVTRGHGSLESVLLWLQRNALCNAGFLDDVIFHITECVFFLVRQVAAPGKTSAVCGTTTTCCIARYLAKCALLYLMQNSVWLVIVMIKINTLFVKDDQCTKQVNKAVGFCSWFLSRCSLSTLNGTKGRHFDFRHHYQIFHETI